MNAEMPEGTALLANAVTARDKLRADIAETERDIAFQQMRLEVLEQTLALLEGADTRPRQVRRRRIEAVPSAPTPDPAA
jgi:hypothetical protein